MEKACVREKCVILRKLPDWGFYFYKDSILDLQALIMGKNTIREFPEVFLSHQGIAKDVTRAVKQGKARKIGPRLYTNNMADPPEEIIRRNLWPVVGMLFPGAVVAHRTALEGRPSPTGTVFLAGRYGRTLMLPGLTIRQVTGPGPLEGDRPFVGDLWLASRTRALLESLKPTRVTATGARGLPVADVEERIETIIRASGEEEVNRLRDHARQIAESLDAERELQILDGLIAAMLTTGEEELRSPTAVARAGGRPYDPGRLDLFQELHSALLEWNPKDRRDGCEDTEEFRNLSFFDSYFSNFIEGTEFTVEEAAEIIFENRIPDTRPQDAHDILGTFRLVSNREMMRRSASNIGDEAGGFEEVLQAHHRVIMGGRPETGPGEFKTAVNRAGNTVFVDPDFVEGTLRKGFEVFRSLPSPLSRAVFMIFLISEVHPFSDGNGRLARVMMNAELIAGGQRRVLIPTAYREDYLLALRAMTRQANPTPLIRMLDYAQEFTSRVDFRDYQTALAMLGEANAFLTRNEAHLRMPEPGDAE